ncbi:hypothetical protein Fot_41905 [Forsythia ovata]|uniref:Uncharacterized protein n=1 Tax=Forsythia ovata TaxID=205694 RepID=A0ABD1RJN2_9LAMI
MVGQWAGRATSIVENGQLGCVVHGGGRRTARLKGGTSMVVHGEEIMVQGGCGRSLCRERCVNGGSRRWWEVTAQREVLQWWVCQIPVAIHIASCNRRLGTWCSMVRVVS